MHHTGNRPGGLKLKISLMSSTMSMMFVFGLVRFILVMKLIKKLNKINSNTLYIMNREPV